MNRSEIKCEVVNVRMTPDEKTRLQEEARAAGLTLSELVRRRYLGRSIIADVDLALIRELRVLAGALRGEGMGAESSAIYNRVGAAMEALAARRS